MLALAVLPRALRERSAERVAQFEESYEWIGIPALVLQVITGAYLALQLQPRIAAWFDLSLPVSRLICLKLGLLGATLLLALHARLRLVPQLDQQRLGLLAWHIAGVTLLAVALVVTGVAFRVGGFP